MAPKKSQPKRTSSPASSYTSSSEDEPEENQVKPSQNSSKNSGAAVRASQSAPPNRPQPSEEDTDYSSDDSESTTQGSRGGEEHGAEKRPSQSSLEKNAKGAPPSSGSESESGEDGESPPPAPPESHTPDPSAKPTVSKSMADESAAGSSKNQQGDKKRKFPDAASPAKSKEENNDKKRKLFEIASSPASKEESHDKKPFGRLWSADDELTLLRASVTFKEKHGYEPTNSAEIDTLYNACKMSFHADITRSQFLSKLQNLRRKYSRYWSKDNEEVPRKKFSNANVQAAFDLAFVLWGSGNKSKDAEAETDGPSEHGGRGSKLVRQKATTSGKSKDDNSRVSFPVSDGGQSRIIDFVANEFNWTDHDSLKRSFALLDFAECKIIDDIWNNLKLKEMEFQIHRLEAAKEIIRVVKDKANH